MSANNDFPAGLTPLREPTFFILLALSKQRKHGYAILKDVETLSGGRVKLSTGTLYGALARLLTQELIQRAAEEAPDALEDDAEPGAESEKLSSTRQRKYYQLTQFGRRVLKEELQRLQALLAAARQELGREGL